MSFDGVFYIKKWCAEEERFFQFSKFLDQAIRKVFIRVKSFFVLDYGHLFYDCSYDVGNLLFSLHIVYCRLDM